MNCRLHDMYMNIVNNVLPNDQWPWLCVSIFSKGTQSSARRSLGNGHFCTSAHFSRLISIKFAQYKDKENLWCRTHNHYFSPLSNYGRPTNMRVHKQHLDKYDNNLCTTGTGVLVGLVAFFAEISIKKISNHKAT